jgi:hypothetical protein
MVALYTVGYNCLKMHKTLKMTPAMADDVTAHDRAASPSIMQ